MKRYKLVFAGMIAGVGALVLGVAFPPTTAWSTNIRSSNDQVSLASSETHDGSLYAVGKTVRIDGNVKGDLYCAASSVEINGTIDGDVLCAAQSMVIAGDVADDVRVASQEVSVSSTVGGSMSAMA